MTLPELIPNGNVSNELFVGNSVGNSVGISVIIGVGVGIKRVLVIVSEGTGNVLLIIAIVSFNPVCNSVLLTLKHSIFYLLVY